MSETSSIVLTFYSNIGQVVSLIIPRANLALTADAARQAMDGIISTGIVITGNGVPQTVRGAEFITTVRTNLLEQS